MKGTELKRKYLEFFKEKGHVIIESAPLIPEHDPTVLFTTAGMHPLVPFLMGQKHPLGKRLADVQKCLRTQDIDEVGDETHTTFFEMLGNWSLGDYFKKEAIEWSFEFLTSKKWLGIPLDRLGFTCFAGDKDAPKDEDASKIWLGLGVAKERIAFLAKADNWWGPAGEIGPCGPDTEMFYWVSDEKPPKKFDPKDKRWVEIWNDVFIQYNKDKRLILVDGMYCLYNENFNINKELLDMINSFNAHTILAVNGFREKGYTLIKNYDLNRDTNWKAFSLEEKRIKKDNIDYFKELIREFKNLTPEEIIYFDHDKKNVETAQKLGILSKHYTDIKSIKKFIEDNLWAFFPLKQKNVDTGLGVERVAMVLQGKKTIFETDLFAQIMKKIEEITGQQQNKDNIKSFRVIADHMKAAVFILGDERGVVPSNVDQGYVLRRYIRRVIRHLILMGTDPTDLRTTADIAKVIINMYKSDYPILEHKKQMIFSELQKEQEKFQKTLHNGLKEFEKISARDISGQNAFLLFQSYGFPLEMTQELAAEKGIKVDASGFNKEFEKHQQLSRIGAEQKFKGGLSEASETTTKLHTATHLLNEALRRIVSPDIKQKGSNITAERLRFDFNLDRKMTPEEIKKVEDWVNKRIDESIDVVKEEMTVEEAKKKGAQAEFGVRYPEKVSVYSVGKYSKEICMGPHVKNTSELGHFKILKEESSAAGIRRIKAVLSPTGSEISL
jgi:alanyl-tRNA synthetase